MRHLTTAFFTAGFLLCISGVTIAQSTANISTVITFRENGKVTKVEAAGPSISPSEVSPKERVKILMPVESISTAADSASSLVLGGVGSARLGEESEIRVPQANGDSQSLEMLKGRLFLNISAKELSQRKKGEFRLKTPAALLAVKGTKFFVISNNGADTIGVIEGVVSVTDSRGRNAVNVTAGQAVTVAGDTLAPARPLTTEEIAYQHEIALAEVVRTPVALVLEKAHDQTVTRDPPVVLFNQGRVQELTPSAYAAFKNSPSAGPYLRWQGWEGEIPTFEGESNAAATKPLSTMGEQGVKILPDGMLSYAWNWSRNQEPDRNVAIEAGSLAKFDFYPHDFGQGTLGQCIGLEFQARGKDLGRVKATTASGAITLLMPRMMRMEMVVGHPPSFSLSPVPLATGGGQKSNDVERGFVWMAAYPTTTSSQTKSTRDDTASLQLGQFVLLTLPK